MHVYHCALRVTYRKLYFQTKTEEKILGLVKKKGSKFSLGYVSLKTCRKTVQLPSKNLLVFFRLDDIKQNLIVSRQCHLNGFTGL